MYKFKCYIILLLMMTFVRKGSLPSKAITFVSNVWIVTYSTTNLTQVHSSLKVVLGHLLWMPSRLWTKAYYVGRQGKVSIRPCA